MSFDTVAPFYRTLEAIVFGNALQRARTAFIHKLCDCRRALIAGEGNGLYLAELLATNPSIEITCVDQSTKMLELARSRIVDPQQRSRVQFIAADLLETQPHGSYDVVVTNFFFDCFDEEQLPRVVSHLAACAAPNARWLVADFTAARRGKPLVALMYAFFRLTANISASRLVDYTPFLHQHGFLRQVDREFHAGLVRAELWRRNLQGGAR